MSRGPEGRGEISQKGEGCGVSPLKRWGEEEADGQGDGPRVTLVPKDESDFLVLGPLIERGCPMGRLKSSLI